MARVARAGDQAGAFAFSQQFAAGQDFVTGRA
jgi:hypothetical protein